MLPTTAISTRIVRIGTLIHIDDACEAHIFCMEKPSMVGRFLYANGYPRRHDYAQHFTCKHSQMEVIKG